LAVCNHNVAWVQEKVKLAVDKEFTLEQIRDAHKYAEGGHVRGKVVIKVSA